jgi:hypothetical protein
MGTLYGSQNDTGEQMDDEGPGGGVAGGGRRPARGSPPVPPSCPDNAQAPARVRRDGALRLQAPPIGGPPPRLPHQH